MHLYNSLLHNSLDKYTVKFSVENASHIATQIQPPSFPHIIILIANIVLC